jgi:hypothetical protein
MGAKRQFTSSKGPERMGIRHHSQGATFPSKGILVFSFLLNEGSQTSDYLCVQNKQEISVHVKNKPRVGIQNMALFLVHQSSW